MKKLYIVWAALVAVVLFVLAVRYIPEYNPDFGLVEAQYGQGRSVDRSGESTGKPFDVVYGGIATGYYSEYAHGTFFIRPNDGGTLYADIENSKLEKNILGVWVEASPRTGKNSAIDGVMMTDAADGTQRGVVVQMHTDDYYATYRLTLVFTENKDGSGERYTLRLRFAP